MMRQVAFLLMIVASASGFLNKLSVSCHPGFDNFITKHIMADRMLVDKCFDVLKEKKINQEGKDCKETNTFIHAPLQDVIKVCEDGVKEKDDFKKSKGKFNMTVCRVNNGEKKFPECKYKGKLIEAKILIQCSDGGLPVHFHGSPKKGHSEALFWSEK